MTRLGRRNDPDLRSLADRLIARHVRISVPDTTVRVLLASTQLRSPDDTDPIEHSVRCVAVVGAGASFPLLSRGDELAGTLEHDYGRDDVELDRLALVNNLNPKYFETRLIALSKTPDVARKVRQTISDQYDVRHPPMLAYELLAHLLKHRFLDAIISFNFDELLDRSLDDELDSAEYRRVVSDRDCADVQSDADADDYLPLYIKLHGTASEPDSLRFTPDSYYSLPSKVLTIVEDLFNIDHCVAVVAGSSLRSFDFQRLLALPSTLELYNLSYDRLPGSVVSKITAERRRAKKDRSTAWLHECDPRRVPCDEHLRALTRTIGANVDDLNSSRGDGRAPLVAFRSALRHEVVAQLLGPRGDSVAHTKSTWADAAEVDYLRQRTILELALAGAKARGLISLTPLARDRPGRYFDVYRKKARHPDGWQDLCSAAGLTETENIPDVLVSAGNLRQEHTDDDGGDADSSQLVNRHQRDPTQKLHKFDPGRLAALVGSRVGDPRDQSTRALLRKAFTALQTESDTELHTQDDRVCGKAFRNPVILRTQTSMNAYTWLMFRALCDTDTLYVSAETGEWLTRSPIHTRLAGQHRIRVLVAFDTEVAALRERYDASRMEIRYVNPWHHNRHMTIVCNREGPARAIYFARHLRTSVITAVYLSDVRDVQRLLKAYRDRWKEATRVPELRPTTE